MLGWFGRMLTFEVEADDGPVALGGLLTDASAGSIDAADDRSVAGFAAHGSSVGDALSGLIAISGVQLAERDGALRTVAAGPPVPIQADELGCDMEGRPAAKVERRRTPDSSMPSTLTMTYYDPARDYQGGQMRASIGAGGTRDERIELPAVLGGGEAKALVEESLARSWRSGDRLRIQLPPIRMDLRPGVAVQLPSIVGAWTARSVSIEGLVATIEAERSVLHVSPLPADPGRPVAEPDLPVGRSEMALFELPPAGEAPAPALIAFVAASNSGTWKPLPVEMVTASGAISTLTVSRRAVLGRSETVLAARSPMILDDLSDVTVRLVDGSRPLLNADEDMLIAGSNLAVLGNELIQFGCADQLAPGAYRLSRLLRGRRGTEWAAASHQIGEAFCLIDAASPRQIELPSTAVGASLKATAHGIGDVVPLPFAERLLTGEALRPPSPCQLRAWREASRIDVEWTRRSHLGWAWTDGVGVGSDPFPELYRLTLEGSDGALAIETDASTATFEAAELPGQPGQSISLSIVTVGPLAVSHPASASIQL